MFEEINSSHLLYPYMEELLHVSFPENERRDDCDQRFNADKENSFHPLLIKEGELPVGILTYWNLDDFIYIEHFAVNPILRGKGIGRKALKEFIIKRQGRLPIVLEVEHPDNDISLRRIQFYERLGFVLWRNDYMQPPYRMSDKEIPLYLMVYGNLSSERDYPHIVDSIHHHVYKQG